MAQFAWKYLLYIAYICKKAAQTEFLQTTNKSIHIRDGHKSIDASLKKMESTQKSTNMTPFFKKEVRKKKVNFFLPWMKE